MLQTMAIRSYCDSSRGLTIGREGLLIAIGIIGTDESSVMVEYSDYW